MTISFNDISDTATPSSGNFNVGGSVNLKGTGTNLVLQSQTLATSPWGPLNSSTLTNNATSAPDGTNTATKLAEPATTTNYFGTAQNISSSVVSPSTRYTQSFYAKAAERTQAYIQNTVSQYTVYIDLSGGTIISGSGTNYVSSSIV